MKKIRQVAEQTMQWRIFLTDVLKRFGAWFSLKILFCKSYICSRPSYLLCIMRDDLCDDHWPAKSSLFPTYILSFFFFRINFLVRHVTHRIQIPLEVVIIYGYLLILSFRDKIESIIQKVQRGSTWTDDDTPMHRSACDDPTRTTSTRSKGKNNLRLHTQNYCSIIINHQIASTVRRCAPFRTL